MILEPAQLIPELREAIETSDEIVLFIFIISSKIILFLLRDKLLLHYEIE